MQANTTTCSIPNCYRPARSMSMKLCSTHYQRFRIHGDARVALRPYKQFPTCSKDGCEKPHKAHGLCVNHYHQSLYVAKPLRQPKPREEQFWHLVKAGPVPEYRPSLGCCWLWQGMQDKDGYGRFGFGGRNRGFAHHFLVGRPTRPLEWDHLCYIRNCVRPSHLEMVSHLVNARRRDQHAKWVAGKSSLPYSDDSE